MLDPMKEATNLQVSKLSEVRLSAYFSDPIGEQQPSRNFQVRPTVD